MSDTPYTKEFYDRTSKERIDSAREIVPLLLSLYGCSSVLDVGCARGEWLHEIKIRKSDVLCVGIDGPYVDPGTRMPDIGYYEADFEEPLPFLPYMPFKLGLCLEVGEHLSKEAGRQIVRWLCEHCWKIVWSAAIPGQGGVNHINEQWQSYWAEQFENYGFAPSFEIRSRVWNNPKVQPYYAQNIVTYSKPDMVREGTDVMDVVHPRMWEYKIKAFQGR